jgi:hypothetical protein
VTNIENGINQYADTADNPFPSPPFAQTELLSPICAWSDMVDEMLATGIDFDEHWYSCVMDQVAYFYRWNGSMRATVLVVFNTEAIVYIEARRFDDQLVPEGERLLIVDEISEISHLPIKLDNENHQFH